MKKNLFVLAAVFAAIFSSCNKHELEDPSSNQVEFSAAIVEDDDVKTTLGSKSGSTYPLTWSADDKICVNGIMSDVLSSGSGTKSASFKVSGLGTVTSYNITYPGKAGSDNIAVFPTTTSRTAPVLPMYAATSTRSFTMTHLAGILKLSLTSSKSLKINSIELTTPGGEPLGGELTIGKTSGALNGELSGGTNSITVDCGSGISLSSTATSVMIPVPVGSYSQGIKITLTDNSQGSMVLVVLNNSSIEAGKVLEFNTVTYVSDSSSEDLYLINNTATLQSFINTVNSGTTTEKSKNAKVTANFTISSSDAAALAEVSEYYGVFDGNNKTITGLVKPLFNTLYGQIKNLILNSSVSLNEDVNAAGMFVRIINTSSLVDEPGGLYNCTAKGTLFWEPSASESSEFAIGGLVGRVKGGIVSGCSNEATITTSGSTGLQLMLGGVMGRGEKDTFYSQGSDVSNCTNSGTVNFNGTTGNAYIGGVVGYDVYGECSTANCSNTGTVQIGADGYANPVNMGGVVGMSGGALDDNTNSGTVQTLWGGSTGPHAYVGGVIGRTSTTSKTLTNLKNLADGKVIVKGQAYAYYIGGVIGWMKGGKAQGWECAGDVTLDAGGAYTVSLGGLVGTAGNRKYAKTEGSDGSKHLTFTDCTTASTAEIGTTANAYITASSTANDNNLAVGGMFGRINEGITVNGGTSAASVNIIPVTMTSGKQQPYCLGGIVGYASVLSNANTTSGIAFNGVTNTGNVTLADGSNTIYADAKIGGIIGWSRLFKAGAPLVLTDCVNKGTVSCTAAAPKNTYVGGITGVLETTAGKSAISLVRCINGDSTNSALGTVNNTGSNEMNDMIISGICGKITGVSGLPVSLQGCKNYGPVTNSGYNFWTASELNASSWGVLCAGIVGRADGVCNLSATSTTDANRNINYGSITDNSTTKTPCLAGVVGSASGTGPEFEYCENRGPVQFVGASAQTIIISGICGHTSTTPNLSNTSNYGELKVLGNADSKTTSKYVLIGGVLGVANQSAGQFDMEYASNNGNISVKNYALDASGQLFVSGVVGHIGHSIEQAFDHLSNSGSIILSAVDNPVPSTNYQYVAGILATNSGSKTLTNCTNSGEIDAGNNNGSGGPYRLDLKARVGGIASYLTVCPEGSVNSGDISCVKKYNTSNNSASQVGGIVGYMDVAIVRNLTSTGAVRTSGASPVGYLGGIVGQAGTSTTTVENCTVGGYINGGGTTHGGLIFAGGSTSGLTFTNCNAISGAKFTRKVNGSSKTTTYSTVGQALTATDLVLGNSGTITVNNCTVIAAN